MRKAEQIRVGDKVRIDGGAYEVVLAQGNAVQLSPTFAPVFGTVVLAVYELQAMLDDGRATVGGAR